MIKTDSIFYGLSDKECEAVAITEGLVFVCALKSNLRNIVKSHIRFLTEIQRVSIEDISTSPGTLWNFKYTIITLPALSSFSELTKLAVALQGKGGNLYCIGAPSEWTHLCKNIPVSFTGNNLLPNISIDCTEHKPYFFLPRSKEEILDARLLLTGLLSALASRKPPVILFAETEQDYNYIELFKAQYGNKNIICLNNTPDESLALNASKIITVRNSGNHESVEGLMNYVENIHYSSNVKVILYSFNRRNIILQSKLDNCDISYNSIEPCKNLGIPSISIIAADVKRQIIETLNELIHE